MDDSLTQQMQFELPRPKKKGERHRDPYDGLRPWSAITHGTGAGLGIFALIALLLRAYGQGGNLVTIVSFLIYGLSMIGLYTASTLYHSLNTPVQGRMALKKYDHISIYFLIAGSYTPICMLVLPRSWGVPMMVAVWSLTLIGGIMTLFWIHAPRWVTAGIYLFMGWMAVFMMPALLTYMPTAGMVWLFVGGVLYTIGGVLYAVKWPGRHNPRFGCHEIFHLFILLGSVAHFCMMYFVIT